MSRPTINCAQQVVIQWLPCGVAYVDNCRQVIVHICGNFNPLAIIKLGLSQGEGKLQEIETFIHRFEQSLIALNTRLQFYQHILNN